MVGEVYKHVDLVGIYGTLAKLSLREEEGLRAVVKPVYDAVKKFRVAGEFSDEAEEAWEGVCGTSRFFHVWVESKRDLKK